MSDELLRTWGANIRSLRQQRGMSVLEFSKELDVSVATISRWEAGKMAPRDNHKLDIAYALNADVRMIFPLVRVA